MNQKRIFYPKILTTIKDYKLSSFLNDFSAGIIVGIVALPLAIAFGIASGVTPQQGLITAIIAGFFISLLGGSRVQIGGPTGAFIVIVYGIIEKHGISGLLIATVMAGIILVLMGIFRLGTWIKYIPTSVVVGFTSGIAVVIFSAQIPSLLGLNLNNVPSHFFDKWILYFSSISEINWWSFFIAFLTIGIIAIGTKISAKVPSAFFALVVTTYVSYFFKLPVNTLMTQFGEIKLSFQTPNIPHLSFEMFSTLLVPAITIALLGAIESLLSAVVSDGMIGGRHRSNTELIAQGVANIIVPFFGGIPAAGAIARTATNIRNGGRTPIAGIIHAFTLLLIVLFFGHLAGFIPMATLAGILVVVAYNMSEWRQFKELLSSPRSDIAILIITFSLTVIFDLVIAIQVGMILSTFIFMSKMSDASFINKYRSGKWTDEYASKSNYYNRPTALSKYEIPSNIAVFEIRGAFFFGAASKFEDILNQSKKEKKVIILRMNQLYVLDATGINVIRKFAKSLKDEGTILALTELNYSCEKILKKSRLTNLITENNIHLNLEDALRYYQNNLKD